MESIESFRRLTEQLCKLPGIGQKTAQRLAYFIIKMPPDEVKQFARDMYDARIKIKYCSICGNLSDEDICGICSDKKRDTSIICVVKDAKDVFAIERTQEYRGIYHVLGGVISPLENIGPDDIAIKQLVARLTPQVKELILATNPDIGGEATAAYISRLLDGFDIKITRIAHGIPIGAELEYADEVTLAKAIEGRRSM